MEAQATPEDADRLADLWATATSLRIDTLAARTWAELGARGIESILLKGPSFARWLYQGGPARFYTDADFLVSPDNWEKARELLGELGYETECTQFEHPQMGSVTSEGWMRGDDHVDLHCTLWGTGIPPAEVWTVLSGMTEPMPVGGSELPVLVPAARTVHLALHAAQHGDPDWKTGRDLKRGIAVLPEETWQEAAGVAERLGALPAFATGLRMVPEGLQVASRLGLDRLTSADAALRVTRTPLASGLEHLAQTPGTRGKLRVLKSELFPTASFLRWWSPVARKGGPIGLAAAYVWRWVWMAWHGIPGYLAWRSARRAAADSAARAGLSSP